VKIAIYGLGYVGTVSAAALASLGHEVTGVDTSERKVEMLAAGETPVLEPGLAELVASEVEAGRLRATTDGERAAAESTLSLICVDTPSRENGALSTDALERVAATIGRGLRSNPSRHTVVLRSTSLPGTAEDLVAPAEATGVLARGELAVAVDHGVRPVADQTTAVEVDRGQRLAAHRLDREAPDLAHDVGPHAGDPNRAGPAPRRRRRAPGRRSRPAAPRRWLRSGHRSSAPWAQCAWSTLGR